MYEGGVRVPLLVAGAGVVSPKRQVSAPVSAVDLFPTILELGGIDHAAIPATDGVSLMPYLQARFHPARRTWIYTEQFTTSYDRNWQRAIRNTRYKLIERYDGSREFYDLNNDALETKNLLKGTIAKAQRNALNSLNRQMDALLSTR
jgi:arylsulfatase A-like enzyme